MFDEYMKAIKDLKIAYNHFENAEPDFVEAAIAELTSAEFRVGAMRLTMNTRYGIPG